MNRKEMICYETDASRLKGRAEKVVFPKSASDVQKIVNSSNMDIVPRGAGTSLVGGCIPNNSIVVDMSKMNKVSNLDFKKDSVYAEPGVSIKELNEKLEKIGFEFPIIPDEKGISTIGGMIALNALGRRSMRYGLMKDWIDEIEFVNGRGELMRTGKSDLMDVCGMEGITGIITGARLKIIPKTEKSASIFQTDDLDEVLSIARRLKLEKDVISINFLSKEVSVFLGFSEKYHIIIEFNSERGKIRQEEYDVLLNLINKINYTLASKNYYNSEDPKFFFDKLKEFILFLEENNIIYFGNLGIGIIYPFFKDEEKIKRDMVVDFIKRTKAKFSKYGIGLSRKYSLDDFEKKVIHRVKLRHDPFGKLNKGKVIDVDSKVHVREKMKSEASRLKGIEQTEVEEIKKVFSREKEDEESGFFYGEQRSAQNLLEELKTPEEKLQELIEKAEEQEKQQVKQQLGDYKETFDSELTEEKRKEVEEYASHVSENIVKKSRINPSEYNQIRDIMNNRFGFKADKDLEVSGKVIVEDSLAGSASSRTKDLGDDFNKPKEVYSNSDRDLINNIMLNKFKKEDKKKDKKDEYRK